MNPWLTIKNRARRDASRLLARRLVRIAPAQPLISFTFDDFPRSALHVAGPILRAAGYHGTYYTSFGLMGKTAPTGEIFVREDLTEFVRQGHELGCHTFDHCHAWETAPAEFEASILRNQRAAADLLPGTGLHSLSYPISGPRPHTKQLTAKHYACARGGGQTHNVGNTDLNCLRAFFLEQSRDNFPAIRQAIADNRRDNGWLIFATHDVTDNPTRYGCTPALFEQVVRCAAESGATVLPVYQAWQQLQSSPCSACHCH